MDLKTRVAALKTTTFCGRRFSREQIIQIAETVSMFPNLSRNEVAHTICEHINWCTPTKSLKINSALALLSHLESLGICTPPPKMTVIRSPNKIKILKHPCNSTENFSTLAELMPINLKVVEEASTRDRFNTLMSDHHYLGYKHPYGASLRYFIFDKDGRELGMLLFTSAAWSLKSRDEWIGWSRKHRVKRLHLIVCNSRFLIFPWIKTPNLASKVLSLITTQLADDWFKRYAYMPVLIETFVDQEKYLGTCYQASNWLKVGQTAGRGRNDRANDATKTIKDIFVQPISENFRDILLRGKIESKIRLTVGNQLSRLQDNILSFWNDVAPIIHNVAKEFDDIWQVKHRIIDSMLLVLIIFRLVATKAKQGYGTTIDELWDNCRKQKIPLPQEHSIAASSFTDARVKLDEQIFKTINTRIIHGFKEIFDRDEDRFYGHRLYAVDGSKVNVPRPLMNDGFKIFKENCHYPQGMLSTLYNLRAQIPVDFIFSHDHNERRLALEHLSSVALGDIVIYDRGYFSYLFLHAHYSKGINAVFRLSKVPNMVKNFMESGEIERIVMTEPDTDSQCKIKKTNPSIEIKPLSLRLIRYEIEEQSYFLGTTLIDKDKYPAEIFKDLYHERWGIEELYKISKQLIAIEEFHAKSTRGVKQELYAHLALITLNRIITNHVDDQPNCRQKSTSIKSAEKVVSNFKNSMANVARNIESLLLFQAHEIKETLKAIVGSIYRRCQRMRPGRSYSRQSQKPQSKWQKGKVTPSKVAASANLPIKFAV